MLQAATLALSEILTPPFRAVLWKSLGLTLALLALAWLGLQALVEYLVNWASLPGETYFVTISGIGFVVGLGFLVAPVSALMAGLFSDDISALVEAKHYPQDPPGRGLSFGASLLGTLGFTATVIAVNIVCLALLLVPGVNLVAFFIGNGYLLGREFFEATAARFRGVEGARALRRENGLTVLLAGFVIALFLAIPIVNLLTPLFATAFMTHLHKRLTGSCPVDAAAP